MPLQSPRCSKGTWNLKNLTNVLLTGCTSVGFAKASKANSSWRVPWPSTGASRYAATIVLPQRTMLVSSFATFLSFKQCVLRFRSCLSALSGLAVLVYQVRGTSWRAIVARFLISLRGIYLMDMNVCLRERNADAFRVQSLLDQSSEVPIHLPVVACEAPRSDNEIHRTVG